MIAKGTYSLHTTKRGETKGEKNAPKLLELYNGKHKQKMTNISNF